MPLILAQVMALLTRRNPILSNFIIAKRVLIMLTEYCLIFCLCQNYIGQLFVQFFAIVFRMSIGSTPAPRCVKQWI